MRLRHPSALLAAAIALVGGGAAPAAGQESTGQFSINPGQRDVTARPPVDLGPTAAINSTSQRLSVSVRPALLGQQLSGSFVPVEDAGALARAARLVTVRPRRFSLEPGQVQQVAVRWNRVAPAAEAAYVGLIFRGVPPSPEGGIVPIVRLVQSNLLRLPARPRARGGIAQLAAEQGEPSTLRLLSRVRNRGEVDSVPRDGRLVIRDAAGRRVFTGTWGGGNTVLPGYAVEYPVEVRRVLPAGRYRATSSVSFGARRSSRSTSFELVGPNELPTIRFDLVRVAAEGEVGGPAQVAVRVENTGTAASDARVVIRLRRTGDDAEPAAEELTLESVAVGEEARARVELGELEDAAYEVEGALLLGGDEIDTQTVAFRPSARRGFVDRATHAVADSLLLTLLVGLLLVAAAAAAVFAFRRRGKGADPAGGAVAEPQPEPAAPAPPEPHPEPAAPAPPEPQPEPAAPAPPEPQPEPAAPAPPEPQPEPAAPAPPSPAAIDLNTATADELLRLPGVGRKAAERIVAYREQHGRFTSVDDLQNVEGFEDPARIRRLEPEATT